MKKSFLFIVCFLIFSLYPIQVFSMHDEQRVAIQKEISETLSSCSKFIRESADLKIEILENLDVLESVLRIGEDIGLLKKSLEEKLVSLKEKNKLLQEEFSVFLELEGLNLEEVGLGGVQGVIEVNLVFISKIEELMELMRTRT